MNAGSKSGSNMGDEDAGDGVASGVERGVWNTVSSSDSLLSLSLFDAERGPFGGCGAAINSCSGTVGLDR